MLYRFDYLTPTGRTGSVVARTAPQARAKAWRIETGPSPFQGYAASEIRVHRGPEVGNLPTPIGMER